MVSSQQGNGEAAPLYDDDTGVPLNEAARRIVEKGKSKDAYDSNPGAVAAAGQGVLSKIPEVDIAVGKWKYVQIELSAPGESPKRVVRNTAGLPYHPDMYNHAMAQLESQGLGEDKVKGRVIGGGRIEYYPDKGTCFIYGYSKSFGRAPGCNQKSAEIVEKAHPELKVTWSDDGY